MKSNKLLLNTLAELLLLICRRNLLPISLHTPVKLSIIASSELHVSTFPRVPETIPYAYSRTSTQPLHHSFVSRPQTALPGEQGCRETKLWNTLQFDPNPAFFLSGTFDAFTQVFEAWAKAKVNFCYITQHICSSNPALSLQHPYLLSSPRQLQISAHLDISRYKIAISSWI